VELFSLKARMVQKLLANTRNFSKSVLVLIMNDRLQNAFLGSLVADAVAMPVHWYYNTEALDRDFPVLDRYHAPKPKHPDSILWRPKYQPRNKEADILGKQAQYWGQREVHYHQFLPAGENTVNFLLAAQLYRSTVRYGNYDAERWLDIYVDCMLQENWHNDTYLEEYHRAFFENRALGKPLNKCGIDDIHIGGLSSVPALLAALDALQDETDKLSAELIVSHVRLTHINYQVEKATKALVAMLKSIAAGSSVREAIQEHAGDWVNPGQLNDWAETHDRAVVGSILSPACYLPTSFTASLFLAWKYADDFSGGILANAKVGGDNCHRGAVVGSLLGAANDIDQYWLKNLHTMKRLRCDTLAATF
jgi:ADP-ribosylglycohydrolase